MGSIPLIEFGKKLMLGVSDGLSVESGNLCSSFCLVDSCFGLGGEEGAVTLRVGVTLRNGGGDARCAGVGRSCIGDGSYGVTRILGTARTMSGEALGHLLF